MRSSGRRRDRNHWPAHSPTTVVRGATKATYGWGGGWCPPPPPRRRCRGDGAHGPRQEQAVEGEDRKKEPEVRHEIAAHEDDVCRLCERNEVEGHERRKGARDRTPAARGQRKR